MPKKTSFLVNTHFWYVPHANTSWKYPSCTHALLYVPGKNVPKEILYCTNALQLYFTCERDIRRILYFTHALQLYSIRRTLLDSKPIWWYRQRTVCTWLWDCAIFCTILHISALSPRIFYCQYPPTTSPKTTTINTCTLIYASLWTSMGPLPWWKCLPFGEEYRP